MEVCYYSEKEVRLSSDSDGSADAGDEGGEVERISYDEAVVKYGSGRFLLFQFGKTVCYKEIKELQDWYYK